MNRNLDIILGTHFFTQYLNVTNYISMWMRSMRQKKAEVRKRHLTQLFLRLRNTVIPDMCYHEQAEEYFENPLTYKSRGGCDGQCSFCNGDYLRFCGPISKSHLVGALQTRIFDQGSVRADKLVTFITDKKNTSQLKKNIWGGKISAVSQGQVHALVLMLIATDCLTLDLSSSSKIGSDYIKPSDVIISLTKTVVESEGNEPFDEFIINQDDCWTKFQLRL